MHKLILLLCLFAAVSVAQYTLYYTAYQDNTCSSVDAAHTGEIIPYKCALEYRKQYRTGKITFVNQDYLTSCDYTDQSCTTQTVCQNYTNGNCYASSSSPFSNKYIISLNDDGTFAVRYTDYSDQSCTTISVDGPLNVGVCSPEFIGDSNPPQSGRITYIDDNYLISCDYSDQNCNVETICERYNNSICYGSKLTPFSNKYSWTLTATGAATQPPADNTGLPPLTPTQAPTGTDTNQPPTTTTTTAPVATTPTTPTVGSTNSNDYIILYSAYNDNRCNALNNAMTGQIFAHTCAPEQRNHVSGKITRIDDNTLTSCDYSDAACTKQTVCEEYTNNVCYSSSSVQFSNKYSWTSDGNGGYTIQYLSYNDQTCTTTNSAQTGQIFYNTCAAEYGAPPASGEITFINDDYLTSCDYADSQCQVQIICVNYTNSACSDSSTVSFSDMYSWKRKAAAGSSSGDSSSSEGNLGTPSTGSGESQTGKYTILYSAYNDNTCTNVDAETTGQIQAYKCAGENRKAHQSGKIVFINKDYLVSCDYSDNTCTTKTDCQNYTNSVCYSSGSADFSNQYSWTTNADGTFTITYTSYSDKNCNTYDLSGEIFVGVCADEYRAKPQSGKITFINDYYLTSCDYSDDNCGSLTLCENYTNNLCYASSVTAFSNKYSWTKVTGAAPATVASFALVFAALIAALF